MTPSRGCLDRAGDSRIHGLVVLEVDGKWHVRVADRLTVAEQRANRVTADDRHTPEQRSVAARFENTKTQARRGAKDLARRERDIAWWRSDLHGQRVPLAVAECSRTQLHLLRTVAVDAQRRR